MVKYHMMRRNSRNERGSKHLKSFYSFFMVNLSSGSFLSYSLVELGFDRELNIPNAVFAPLHVFTFMMNISIASTCLTWGKKVTSV